MNTLDGEADTKCSLAAYMEKVAGRGDEQRAKAFAAANGRITHRLIEAAPRVLRNSKEQAEQAVDVRPCLLQRCRQAGGLLHLLSVAEGNCAARAAVAAELDLLDPRLRSLEARLALLLQPIAFTVKFNGLVERRFTAFKLPNDLLEPL